jgi:hypothetical protein
VAERGKQSFWSTAPGVVTAVAGLISALGVLIGSLAAAGVIGGDGEPSSGTAEPTQAQTNETTLPAGPGVDRIARYAGTWTNEGSAAETVTRIRIDGSGPLVNVHAFASCTPVDCDWGTRSPEFADPLVALFDLGNGRTEKLTMLLSSDATRLDVTDESSATGTHTYAFHR